MGEDFTLLIVGAVMGFLSALLVELIRIRLEQKRLKKERSLEAREKLEKNRREFLSNPTDKRISPAWLTLVKTHNSLSLFPRVNTEDSMAAELLENPDPANGASVPSSTVEKFLLAQTQIIGRDDDCEIRLTDSTVSRLHAMIRYEVGKFVIYDLGSKSGTFVNGRQVSKKGTPLHSADKLVIGESVLYFYGDTENTTAPASEKKNEAVITRPPKTSRSKTRKIEG